MFTGLIQELGKVRAIEREPAGVRLEVETSLAPQLSDGDSIAVNGVCLTVVTNKRGVFTADVMHGFEIARRVRTGTFSINTYVCDLNSPFGGNKQSGLGREDGVAGLMEYLQPKTISVDPSGELPAEILAATERARWEA